MKKKLWCVLCIMICMMMIAACGQKKNPEKKKSEKAEQACILQFTPYNYNSRRNPGFG